MPGSITSADISVSFITTAGRPPGPARQTERIERPGVDGIELRRTGSRAREGSVTVSVAASSWANAQIQAATLESLQGRVCTYTDAASAERTSLVLENVDIQSITAAAHMVGATGTHVVRAVLTLIDIKTA